MKHIKLKTLICIIAVIPLACKKEEKKEAEPKNQFNAGGINYTIVTSRCSTTLLDCFKWHATQSGSIVNSKTEGLSLIFFTHFKNDLNEGYSLTINLFGVDVGLYKGKESFCKDFTLRYNSMAQASDGSGVAIFKDESEVEITKKSGNEISGNFKLKIDYNKDFLKDSFIVGEFHNIKLNQ
ncbi:MAG: hypothetical protein Q8K70_12630 [Bacteroidota bacterium]|nr:hypothetical protein [Bacteroidota bacterium]